MHPLIRRVFLAADDPPDQLVPGIDYSGRETRLMQPLGEEAAVLVPRPMNALDFDALHRHLAALQLAAKERRAEDRHRREWRDAFLFGVVAGVTLGVIVGRLVWGT